MNLFRYLIKNKELCLILLLVIFNFATKYLIYETNYDHKFYPSAYYKAFLFVIVLVAFFKQNLKEQTGIFVLILLFAFCLDLVFSFKDYDQHYFVNRSYYLIKHLFFLLLIPIILHLDKKVLAKLIDAIIILARINLILVIIGLIFQLNIFKSYPNSLRFGYNGLLPIQGAGSFFYVFIITLLYFRVNQSIRNKTLTQFQIVELIVFVVSSLIIGTKSIYLFVSFVFMIDLVFRLNRKKELALMLSTLLVVFLFFKEKIIYKIQGLQNLKHDIYGDYGFLTFVTSKRDLLLKKAFNFISENWSLNNYIAGGIDFRVHRVEFEIVDVFLFFGILGVIAYYMVFKKFFVIKYVKKDKMRMLYNALLISTLFIGVLSGNLVSSIANSSFFCLVFVFLKREAESTLIENDKV